MNEKPIILFESFPDFSGSPLEIYNELVTREYDKTYDLIWATYSHTSELYKTVPFFNWNNQQKQHFLKNVKIIIDSNRYIQKTNSNYRLHVRHGCSFKKCSQYYSEIGNVDAILSTSKDMIKIDESVWPSYLKNKFIETGLPSNDRLFHPTDLYNNGFLNELTGCSTKFKYIIGWLPTYRQHRFDSSSKTKHNKFNFGLPTIKSQEQLQQLNSLLNENNSLLIIQQHHAQYHNYKCIPKLSNIYFVSEKIKEKYNILTQDLLASFDSMITDYSAAYHEYILMDKPIAITTDDIFDYNRRIGFCYNFIDWIQGEYINNFNMLYEFITDVLNGYDIWKPERTKAKNRIHTYQDGNSSKRVIDYLETNNVL